MRARAVLVVLSAFAFIPASSKKSKKTVRIGVISASTDGLYTTIPLFEEIIEPDINAYVAKLPRFRFRPRLEFEFLIEDAEGSAEIHLEKVQMFHEMGVDLIIGGGWSSQAHASLDYVNDNDMLLISASSTSPVLAIPDDNLYRLAPDDTIQGKIIAKMMQTKGVTNPIVIYRNDAWGNGLYEVFETEYAALGGSILGSFRYEPDETDFTSYLYDANLLAAGMDGVGVLLLSFVELRQIIILASDGNYPNIYNPPWFGNENQGRSEATLGEAPDQAVYLKIFSALSASPPSPKFIDMAVRFEELIGVSMDYYTANQIDAAWIIAQAVLETRPTETDHFGAADVIKVLPDIASRHYGYSGYCLLNEAGDRAAGTFDIWGYTDEYEDPWFKKYGSYDSTTDEITWY